MARWTITIAYLPRCSPCTRRDGPCVGAGRSSDYTFSLHAQGWPAVSRRGSLATMVLPARAGMARPPDPPPQLPRGSPCTRRDGPVLCGHRVRVKGFSLHAQGWPTIHEYGPRRYHVLPAHAGMARGAVMLKPVVVRSPCTRRDGPTGLICDLER